MPPHTSNPSPTPNPNFDFILNQQHNNRSSFSNPLSKLPKAAQYAIIVIAVAIFLSFFFRFVFSSNTGGPADAPALLAQQQEIIRVAGLATTDATSQDTKDIAQTTISTISSQQSDLEGLYLGNSTKTISQKILDAKLDTTTDDTLESAKINNSYDQAFISYLKTALADYQTSLATAYKSAKQNAKDVYSDAYDSTSTILSSSLLK